MTVELTFQRENDDDGESEDDVLFRHGLGDAAEGRTASPRVAVRGRASSHGRVAGADVITGQFEYDDLEPPEQ